jgi:sulfate transport system ATP-binding protein
VIEQVGTPEDIYMSPRSAFVSDFVGETNSLAVSVVNGRTHFLDRMIDVPANGISDGTARLDFRPHEVSLSAEQAGCLPLLVTSVYRRGGEWRVEGKVKGMDRPIEVDLDASSPPPEIGRNLCLKINRGKLFHHSGA